MSVIEQATRATAIDGLVVAVGQQAGGFVGSLYELAETLAIACAPSGVALLDGTQEPRAVAAGGGLVGGEEGVEVVEPAREDWLNPKRGGGRHDDDPTVAVRQDG